MTDGNPSPSGRGGSQFGEPVAGLRRGVREDVRPAAVEPVVDLMAQLAGLRLRERWGGWRQEPFTSESEQHVSVWEKPAG